jgi:hypothetical protein
MAQVNKDNFLTWDDAAPVVGLPAVPWQYHRYREQVGSVPVAVPTEAIGFYVNNLAGIFDETVSVGSLSLDVINATTGATAAAGIEDLERHVVSGDPLAAHRWNPWAIAVWPSLAPGYYRLVIKQGSTVLLTSSLVLAMNDQKWIDEHTVYCRFKHDRYFYGIKYHEIGGYYNQFRLIMGITSMQPKTEKQVYKEAHTGTSRTYNAFLDKVVKLETYYLTPEQHTAAFIMTEMDFVEFNGVRYRLETAYKIVDDALNKVSKGEVEFTEEAFSTANRC